jgi:hypothetical protein
VVASAEECYVRFYSGFSGERVNAYVDGKLMFSEFLQTSASTGLAKTLKLNAGAKASVLEVVIPQKGLSSRYNIDWSKGAVYYINLINGSLNATQAKKLVPLE